MASSSTGSHEDAFHESTPFASSSTTLKKEPLDVFINYRGPDVKSKLAIPIYHVLDLLGVKAFFDREELHLADILPQAIEDAISSALIHIAIFSKGYAGSPWCLIELSFMLETGIPIIPVFYDVQPADLRWEVSGGLYADAFSKYETKGRYKLETLQKWKQALHKVSFYTGYYFKSNSDDLGILLKRIVNRVQQEIKNVKVPFEVARYPVGLDSAVRDFEGAIASARAYQHVQIVGIVGMSGCGKTTLARELYNRKHKAFDNCSFLSEVKEAALQDLQKKLLEDFLHLRDIPFKDASEGTSISAGRLKSLSLRRVLIVLDDVDEVDQLNALLPGRGTSLGSGSLIIVTTCNWGVLRSWGISSVYEMGKLDPRHAKELFCLHAFLTLSPPHGFEDLVQEFINACDGLPLSLKVIAEMLYGKPEEEWKYNLRNISRSLPSGINNTLRLSYDALVDEEKDIFLDVACFFVGEKKNLAIAVWNADEWSGLENLVDKCLVEVDKQNRLRMNNHLRELARQIATERCPHRLWSPEQISKIMIYTQIRGIMAATTQFSLCSAHHEFPSHSSPCQPPFEEWLKIMQNSSSRSTSCKSFSLGLKLLIVTGDDFSRKFAKRSEELVWLRWFDFKDAKLPSWKSLKNLRILELYGATSLKELWEDGTHPPFKQLRELNITCSWGSGLQRFPSSISDLKDLKKIALIGYLGDEFPIKRLPEEFCNLKKLEHLELRQCRVLSSLPSRFGELTMLRHLDLSSCVELRILPVSFKQLTHLEYLDLSGCRKLTFRLDFLENISKLDKLDFSGCRRLQELPNGIASQAYLRQLNMRDTRLRNMASNMDQLRRLLTLQIGSPSLRSLPPSLGYLSTLTHLTIFDCPNLESLPHSLGSLGRLEHLCIESSGVKCLPKSFTKLANLQTLEISGCPISRLHFGKRSSSSSRMRSLKVLHIADTKVSRISISDGCCPVLQTLQLTQNEFLVKIVSLPTSLEKLELWECERLKDISCIKDLPNLQDPLISGCPELDESI